MLQIIGLICALAFPYLIWQAYQALRLAKASTSWPPVPGTITIARRSTSDRRAQPMVVYEYVVEGTTYMGNRVAFPGMTPFKETEAILRRYPVDRVVEVHYMPGNPSQAVLEPGPNTLVYAHLSMYIIVFVLILGLNALAIGLPLLERQGGETRVPVYGEPGARPGQ